MRDTFSSISSAIIASGSTHPMLMAEDYLRDTSPITPVVFATIIVRIEQVATIRL